MTIDSNITKNLDKMSEANKDLASTLVANTNLEQQDNVGVEIQQERPSVFTDDEPIQVAGMGRTEALNVVKDAAKKIVKEKLGKKGTRVEREVEVVEPTQVIEEGKKIEDTIIEPTEIEKPVVTIKETKTKIKPQEEVPQQQYYEVTDEAIDEISKKRERILQEGSERVKPGQVEDGVDVNRLSTLPYDQASEAATAKVGSQTFLKENPKVRKVKDVFQEAERRGIDVKLLEKVAAGKGIDLEAKLGSGAAQDLPEKIAGYIKLHDDNVRVLDDLFEKRQKGTNTPTDDYNLKQHLLWHQEILKGMSNVQTDVAVSLNLFKRASVDFKGKTNVAAQKLKELTEGAVNDQTLTEFTQLWNTMPTVKGKNALVMNQRSFNQELSDMMYTTYKTNLLSSPDTIMENLIGATVTGVKTQLDDWAGVLWGSARRKLLNQPVTRNDLIIDDITNGYVGMRNSIMEAFEAAMVTLKTGERGGFKNDISLSNTWLEKASAKEFKIPFTNLVFAKTPKADNAYWESLVKGMAYFPNIILKTFGAGDEFAGSLFSRMKLHTEASRYSRNRMADLIQAGKSTDDAYKITASEVQSFLKSQPANLYKNVEQAREFINLRYRFANEVKDVDVFGFSADKFASGVGKTYNWVNDKLSNTPFLRYMVPFTNSLTRLFEMSAASIPGLAAISPTYWEDKAAGGARKDRANARMALGSSMLLGFYHLADQGFLTGGGPTDPKFANTLKSRGRLSYAVRLGKDQYEPKDIASLKKILSEDEVSVAQNGDLYVSFERLDSFAMIAGLASDLVEYVRYTREGFNSSETQNMIFAGLASTYNFMSNLVYFESTSRFLKSLQRTQDRNVGRMVADFMQESLSTGASNATMGVPLLSISWNSMAGKWAKSWDEEKKSYDPDVMNIDNSNYAETFLSDTFIQARQNSPLWRGNIVDQHDSLGRPVYDDESYVDSWFKYVPGVRMSKERGEKVDRIMEVYEVGVANPDKVIEGVRLSATQYETYKKLYGNDIKLPVADEKTKTMKNVNLRDAIVTEISNKIYRLENSTSAFKKELVKEDVQKLIDQQVRKYRDVAKTMMYGDPVQVRVADDATVNRYERFYTDPITKERKTNIRFPELNSAINALKNFKRNQ